MGLTRGTDTGLPLGSVSWGSHGALVGLLWGSRGAPIGLPWDCHGAFMLLLMGLPWGCYAAFIGPRCGLYGNADMLAVFGGSSLSLRPPPESISGAAFGASNQILPNYPTFFPVSYDVFRLKLTYTAPSHAHFSQ